MIIKFYNTLTKSKDIFIPIDYKNIRLYVCGPTIYDYIHIGNARSFITFDILYRFLIYIYGKNNIFYSRNITDVDDKINIRAARDYSNYPINYAIKLLTEKMNKKFQKDTKYICCLDPNIQPKATNHLNTMRLIIERLLKIGYAYKNKNHIFFSISKMSNDPLYGALSGRNLKENYFSILKNRKFLKKNKEDFVLWKPSNNNDPGWKSPGGISVKGRPGWHIECSAMSIDTLLNSFGGGLECNNHEKNIFDIHGGGIDLLFPHHENEIAQTCSVLGTNRVANFWMHNGFVQIEGQKMSKSLGNFITVNEILDMQITEEKYSHQLRNIWNGIVIRFAILQIHYREPLNWTYNRLLESSKELYRWYKLLKNSDLYYNEDINNICPSIINALSDDLNTSDVITKLRYFYKNRFIDKLLKGMMFLGLIKKEFLKQDYKLYHTSAKEKKINYYIEERKKAIDEKNWLVADEIRNVLKEEGIILIDYKDSSTGKRITKWYMKNINQ